MYLEDDRGTGSMAVFIKSPSYPTLNIMSLPRTVPKPLTDITRRARIIVLKTM